MNEILLTGSYEHITLYPVRLAFSRSIDEVGQAGWRKVGHLVAVVARIARARLQAGRHAVLYYAPASPNRVPFWRDVILLGTTRWLFATTVFHFHANGLAGLYPRLTAPERLLYRLIYRRPEVAIALSELARADAEHLQSRRIEVVPNGIPDANPAGETVPPHNEGTRQILFLATITEGKGIGVVLDALARLQSDGLDVHLTAVGPFASASEQTRWQARAEALGVAGRVTWAGSRQGVEKWAAYRAAEVFCFPTHYSAEGFPVVVIEAMMWGRPVVATRWRALPELVSDGVNGTLVPPQDPEALATALRAILNDPEKLASWGQAGRERFVTSYTAERFRERMETVLASAGSRKG